MATQAKKLPPGLLKMLNGAGGVGAGQPQMRNENNKMESDSPTNPPTAEPPQVTETK